MLTSLSARRAWIEIQRWRNHHTRPIVALRKESVDRNLMTAGDVTAPSTSLSARRAWIEIGYPANSPLKLRSLSARRAWIEM